MNCPKVTPPFSDEDKKAILDYCHHAYEVKLKVDDQYTGLTRDEALAIILPTTDYNVNEAEFILDMARGELETEYIDENGDRIAITY